MRSALLPLTLTLAFTLPRLALAEAAALADPPAQSPIALPAIAVSTLGLRLMTERVIATGLITPVEEIQVQPLIEGQPIEALKADVGDLVAGGAVLAVLSKTSLELQRAQNFASLAAARATIAQSEAQLIEAGAAAGEAKTAAERAKRLRDQGAVSEAAWDSARANATATAARVSVASQALEAARAQLALAEAQLANVELMLTRTEVKTPYGGRITARNATIGAIASAAGAPMFVLERDGALELRADLAESDLIRLAPGQKVMLHATGLASPVAGKVRLVEPVIDAVTRLGRARIELPPHEDLRAGMFAEAEIIISEGESLALPLSALGNGTVLRVENGLVTAVPVQTGARDGSFIVVTEGLAPGDQVVSRAGSFLRDGDQINPVTEPAIR